MNQRKKKDMKELDEFLGNLLINEHIYLPYLAFLKKNEHLDSLQKHKLCIFKATTKSKYKLSS